MNPDNPYAAPQTTHSRYDMAALPVADLQEPRGQRRRFPERSTVELQRLFDRSQPLEAMFLVWLALWFLAVAVSAAYYLNPYNTRISNVWVWAGIAGVTIRFWCSILRTKLGRWYMLLVDATLIGGCLAWLYALLFQIVLPGESQGVKGVLGLVVLTIAVLAYRACQTLLKVPELFQPVCVQHDDLARELSYRREQQIE